MTSIVLRGWTTLSACGIAALLAGGCPPTDSGPPPFAVSENIQAETVVAGAAAPSALAFTDDGRSFFTERTTGKVRLISAGELLDTPFATVPVNTAGDRGLLGIALHPNFKSNNRVYVFYSRSDSGVNESNPDAIVDNRVVYFEAVGETASGGEVFVASFPVGEGPTRVGGRIGFGRDGKLYVLLGDMGTPNAAQDPATPAGKLLRLNDDGSVPADNPVPGSANFAFGVRLGQGLAFDPISDGIMVLDHNDGGNDEINRVTPGVNLGFPSVVGVAKTSAQLDFVNQNPNYVNPILDSLTGKPNPVGGGFNTSSRYGYGVVNHYFYGESDAHNVIRVALNDDRAGVAHRSLFASGFPSRILDVAITPAGTVYVACETAIYRLAPIVP